jgi:hypothetical protein
MGSSWSAFAFDLPGCVATAATRDGLLAIMPVVIAEHVAWLKRHGITPIEHDSTNIAVVEEVPADNELGVEGEFCFDDDLRPTTTADIEQGIQVMDASRRDLLRAVDGVPDAILDWRPPPSAMAHIDVWKPHPLTIREIVPDVAGAESYYRTALHDGREEGTPDDASDAAVQRALLVAMLRSLSEQDRTRRFAPIRSWQDAPEYWTARKVIRRVISHERFHTAEIRQRLCWLLVGIPDVRRDEKETA